MTSLTSSNLTVFFEKYALLSLEKQEKLARVIGEHALAVDFETGSIRFSGELDFPFQVLGTESDNTLSWLWAWADEQAEIAPELLTASLQMREWGQSAGVPECSIPSVDLNIADGHLLSLIASQVCGASCYYHDSYDGGGLFLLLFGKTIDRQPSLTADALTRQLSGLISLYELNHRNALLSYLKQKDLFVTEHGMFLATELESGEDVRAQFDENGRLLTLNGKTLPLE